MKNQKGAIVVEATISLSAFIFAIFTILSIVDICFTQAKIGVALNTAAKEISQYSYLYYAFNVNELDASVHSGTQDSKQLAKDTIDGVGIFMDSLSSAGASAKSGDFDNMIESINKGADNTESLITQYSNSLKNDPKGFILGMGKMALGEVVDTGKAVLAQVLAKTFMQKNLMSSPNDSADAFLRRHRVVDGLDGLKFRYTSFLANGTSDEIQLVVTYNIRMIQLLGIDLEFTIRQCSKTKAWGNGISILEPKQNSQTSSGSIWDMTSDTERGKVIIAKERENYSYQSNSNGFDAYNNSDGRNEFVTITTANTHDTTNSTVEGIKRHLANEYNKMYNKVAGLGEDVQVQNKTGESVTVHSDPDSRTYRIVIVVPDDADMDIVIEGAKKFKETYPGTDVSIRQGYGSPSKEEKQQK